VNPRVAIVLVVVLVVLYIVGVGVGASPGNNQSISPAKLTPPALAQGIGGVFAPFSPKLKLGQSTFVVAANAIQSVPVPAASDSMRRATFLLAGGTQTTITYCNVSVSPCNPFTSCPPPPPTPATNDLDKQCLRLPQTSSTNGDPRTGPLVVLKDGGTLQFTCAGFFTCTIQLQ
jgi:hypothetical protein